MQAKNVLIALAVALAVAQPVLAKKDRDDDDHPGKGWAKGWDRKGGRDSGPHSRFENNKNHYKYEYSDASCRYKYEYNYRNGKSKVEQRGDCSGIAFPQRVALQGREPLPRAIPPEPQARSIECNREVIGAVLGGAAGAAVGSKIGSKAGAGDDRFITTVGGAVIGAVVGGAIGKSMDDADQACAAQAMEYANFKQSVKWHNPQRGAYYTMTPVGLVPASGKSVECRRYSMLTEQGSLKETTQGTACRQHDGSWRLSG
jgi:surface antigen